MARIINRSSINRYILATVIAPLTPFLLLVVVLIVAGRENVFGNAWPLALFFSVFASYFGLLLLLPIIIYLRRNGKLKWISLVLVGSGGGIVIFDGFLFLFAGMLNTQQYFTFSILDTMWGVFLGLSVAIPFGLIAGINSKPHEMNDTEN